MSVPKHLRVYRSLLRLFPRDFREVRGGEMERLFLDMSAQWVEERGGLGARFWASLFWDTGKEATSEWVSLIRDAIRSEMAQTIGEHMSAFVSDIRYAIRQLLRQPMYGVTIVFLMTLGIAGNAAVFRIYNGLFLKPLPFENPEQLVDLDETAPQWDLEFLNIAYRDFDTWRAENSTFQSMAVIGYGGGTLIVDGAPRRVSFLSTSHDLDDVLQIEPILGRFYGPEEDQPDGPRTMLLSKGFWEQEFGGDPGVLGKTVSLNGYPTEIIGVLPPEARFYTNVDMWLPIQLTRTEFSGWGLNGIGRLKPDATIEQARDDLTAIHKAMIDEFEVNEISSPVINSLRDRYLGDYRLGSGFMLAAVAIVLLIACANIAGLMFVRSLARGPEISIRLALGAPRRRIVRQLLTESLVLAVLGAGSGAALGVWGSNALVAPLANQFPSWITFDLDGRFLLFTLAVTVAAAMLFGLAPALQASGQQAAGSAGSRTTASAARRRGMSLLVTGEVALALALLVVGGLSVLDVRRLGEMDPGFDAEGLISYSLSLPSVRYSDGEARLAFLDEYLPRIQAIPGVESAGAASMMPLSGSHQGSFFMVDGAPPRADDEANPVVLNRVVSPSYFETAGIRFAAGRAFDDFDGREDGSLAVIVNERFVETHLSHLNNAVGARLTNGAAIGEIGDDPLWMTVVGVTRDVKHYGIDKVMRPGLYRPLRQDPTRGFSVALRVRGDSEAVMAQARAITTDMDSELPLYDIRNMTEQVDKSLFTRRAMSWLIGAFSTVALLLAVAGLYGVISYSVGQRTKEISVRMAVGAQKHDVLAQIVRQGMLLVAMGVVGGLVISLAGAKLVSGILVGVEATDPVVYAAVTLLLVVVAGVANYLPARRAASLDPARALRGD